MTQEEKELLLKDLCKRLPHGVKIKTSGIKTPLSLTGIFESEYAGTVLVLLPSIPPKNASPKTLNLPLVECKPYLRPLSSMTKEEKAEIYDYLNKSIEGKLIGFGGRVVWLTDYYLSHHLDYLGLIGKGLANEAPKEMYNI